MSGIPIPRVDSQIRSTKAALAPVVLLACAVMLTGMRFAAHSGQAAEPLVVSEVASGVFMHTGALAP
jgi:hypothetical protein